MKFILKWYLIAFLQYSLEICDGFEHGRSKNKKTINNNHARKNYNATVKYDLIRNGKYFPENR